MRKAILKNISYVFLANSICILINVMINFLIPIMFSEHAYAYFQMENLYCGYLWIISLGWHEGIYIYYGGMSEKEIDKDQISAQFWIMLVYLCIAFLGIVCVSNFVGLGIEKQYVLRMSMLSVVIEAVRYVFLYYLICIDDMRRYSKYLVGDRIVYIFLVIVLLILHKTGYQELIGVDILSKLLLTLWILAVNRTLFFRKIRSRKAALLHTGTLIKSGINVTFASFVNRFINGTVRIAIDAYWGILVFGKISLTLSISNMFTQFIQALSVVLFPALRKTTEEGQRRAYGVISELLDAFMLSLFVLYLPGVKILTLILPQYQDGLRYMAILLPVCLFDARNIILNNTYLKALHKERGILVSNLITVCCSFLFTFLSVYVFHNLDMAVISMVMLVMLKCVCSEIILQRTMQMKLGKYVISEIVMSAVFILSNWYISETLGAIVYFAALIIYFMIKYQNIKNAIRFIGINR